VTVGEKPGTGRMGTEARDKAATVGSDQTWLRC
jgi:hypothetical protein